MIRLELPYPISANRYWATRVMKAKGTQSWRAMTYVTPEADEFRQRVKRTAVAAGIREPIKGRVELAMRLYPNRPADWLKRSARDPANWDDDIRCIDLGNCEKVMSDALQGTVIDDDCWIWKQTGERMEPDAEGARLVIWIRKLPPRLHPQKSLHAEPATDEVTV